MGKTCYESQNDMYLLLSTMPTIPPYKTESKLVIVFRKR
jgi:hypothetical protein